MPSRGNRENSALGPENASRSIPATPGAAVALGAGSDCTGNSAFDGDTADGASPGVVAKIAGSEMDEGDRVGDTPALAAEKTWALGSWITSIMACAKAVKSHPAKAGAGDGIPEDGSEGAGTAGAAPSAPPRESLVFAVGIDFDTFQRAESVQGEGGC